MAEIFQTRQRWKEIWKLATPMSRWLEPTTTLSRYYSSSLFPLVFSRTYKNPNPPFPFLTQRQELAQMKKRLKEMEDEAAALREMQAKVEKEMGAVQGTFPLRFLLQSLRQSDLGFYIVAAVPFILQGRDLWIFLSFFSFF